MYNDDHSTKQLDDGHRSSNLFCLLSYLLFPNKIMFIQISRSLLTFSPEFLSQSWT